MTSSASRLGFSQKYGVDFTETFAPVIKMSSVRLFFALASILRLKLLHGDVPNAYVKGQLKELIFMKPPVELNVEPGKVLRLLKPLYGLKQSGRCWNHAIDQFIRSIGFERSRLDPCIYYKRVNGHLVLLGLYVDDVLFAGELLDDLMGIAKQLEGRFQIKMLGNVTKFLGMVVIETNEYYVLSQQAMINSALKELNFEHMKPVSTPMYPNMDYDDPSSEELVDKRVVREALGTLLWIANCARPDIAFAVNMASRHREKPRKCHWELLKRIFRYLKGTSDRSIVYRKRQQPLAADDISVVIWSDADWAGDRADRKSTSGTVLTLNDRTVAWASKKQSVVAISTMEAEYVAAAQSTAECGWIRQLLGEILDVNITPRLAIDNQSAIKTVTNDMVSSSAKHIAIRYHFVKDEVRKGHVKPEWCASKDQRADILTKALARPLYEDLRTKLGILRA